MRVVLTQETNLPFWQNAID